MMNNQYIEITIKLLLALVAGGLIGLQREFNHNSAGFRTHMLVCLGACIAMLTNEFLYFHFPNSGVDVSRMGQLCYKRYRLLRGWCNNKGCISVRGLTTAAGLWVVACLGIAIGAGYYYAAIVSAILIIIILSLFKMIERKMNLLRNRARMCMEIRNTPGQLASVLSTIAQTGVRIRNVYLQDSDEKWVELELMTTMPNIVGVEELTNMLDELKGVKIKSVDFPNSKAE